MNDRTRPVPDRLTPPAHLVGFDTYRAAVSDAVVSLDIHTGNPEQFQGHLDAGTAGDIHVFDVWAAEHAVRRTPALVARAPQHYFKFTLIEHGDGLIVQGGRETALSAGDMTIYDTDVPYSLMFEDDVRMSIVMFPKALLDIPAETIGRMTAVRLDGSSGVGAMIRPFVSSLAREVTEVEGHVARRLFRTAIDMVGTLLEANLTTTMAGGAHETLMRGILDYIDENLSLQSLNPAQIAAAHFISVRHLHALFSDHGTTVSTVIRTRRLERCYDDLLNPVHSARSVGAIALDHGFVEAAHFSRTFRAHFGVPPSTLRPTRG